MGHPAGVTRPPPFFITIDFSLNIFSIDLVLHAYSDCHHEALAEGPPQADGDLILFYFHISRKHGYT